MKPKVNKYYQHRYGGLYRVTDISTSTVDRTRWVIYVHCYPFELVTWHRPYDEFTDGRFTELSDGEYSKLLLRNKETLQATITAAKQASKSKKLNIGPAPWPYP
jgi:hypothetical protein